MRRPGGMHRDAENADPENQGGGIQEFSYWVAASGNLKERTMRLTANLAFGGQRADSELRLILASSNTEPFRNSRRNKRQKGDQ